MKKLDQNGFSAIEAVLLFVIIIIVGGTGYFVWHAKQNTDKTLSETAKSQPVVTKAAKVTDFAGCKASPGSKLVQGTNPTQCVTRQGQTFKEAAYLTIKEWGIRIPLDETTVSAMYTSGHYSIGSGLSPDDAMVGLLSLGGDCSTDATGAAVGWFVRFTQDDVNAENAGGVTPGNTSLHDLQKTAVQVPGQTGPTNYYFAYAKPTYDCTNGVDSATVTKASDYFAQALKSFKVTE
jgi:hypothetical protein